MSLFIMVLFNARALCNPRLQGFLGCLAIIGYTLLYYASSSVSSIWNKQLVDQGAVSPSVLTLLHLAVSLASDWAVLHNTAEGTPQFPPQHGRHSLRDIFIWFTPISIFVTVSKLTTYVSYQTVSVALSHTAKASEPIFNAIFASFLFNEKYSSAVYASLLPIAVGVTLASTTDFTYNHVGFFWAIVSAATKVLQNIYTKKLMITGKFTFFEIHLYCAAASLIMLFPLICWELAAGKTNPFAHFPFFSLFMCSLLQYVASIVSYKVLHLVSHLTYTIINVLKRLVVIVSGMMSMGQPIGFLNGFGVVLSAVGILVYNIVKEVPPSEVHKMPLIAWIKQALRKYNNMWDHKRVTLTASPSDIDLEALNNTSVRPVSYAWLQSPRPMDTGVASSSALHTTSVGKRAYVRANSVSEGDFSDVTEHNGGVSNNNTTSATPATKHEQDSSHTR